MKKEIRKRPCIRNYKLRHSAEERNLIEKYALESKISINLYGEFGDDVTERQIFAFMLFLGRKEIYIDIDNVEWSMEDG